MKNILQRILTLKGSQSTAAFGRSVGLNQQTMDRYLKGREPPIGVIQQLCVVYGVSANWLLGLPERGGNGTHATAHSVPTMPNCDQCKYRRLAATLADTLKGDLKQL